MKRCIIKIICLLSFILIQGCASMNISENLLFNDSNKKIPENIVIIASSKSKDYVLVRSIWGRTYNVPVGKALLPNAQKCMSSAFIDVLTLYTDEKKKYDSYVLELNFENYIFDIGKTTLSPNEVTLFMTGYLYDKNGNIIWKKSVNNTGISEPNKMMLIGMVTAGYDHDKGIVFATEQSLVKSLEQIREAMLSEINWGS